MILRRSPFSAALIWVVAILAFWVGWPSTGCVCANGGFKFFCDADRNELAGDPLGQSAPKPGDCCQHREAVVSKSAAAEDCRDRSATTQQISGKGCTPVVNTPVVAPAPAFKQVSSDQAVALWTLPVDLGFTPAAIAAIQPARGDTGPPGGLVIMV